MDTRRGSLPAPLARNLRDFGVARSVKEEVNQLIALDIPSLSSYQSARKTLSTVLVYIK